MPTISANEWEVLSFFGVNPIALDETPWPYNSFQYRVAQGSLELTCRLGPASKDIELILQLGSSTIYKIRARQVLDIRYIEEANGKELLDIQISRSHSILMVIQPGISIIENYE